MTSTPRLKDAEDELAEAARCVQLQAGNSKKKPLGRVLVGIDVHELGPIELEVKLCQGVVGGRPCLGWVGHIYPVEESSRKST